MKPYYQDEAVTLYCDDCRGVVPAVTADMIVTDPPYGINHDTNYCRFSGGSHAQHPPIRGDDQPFDPAPLLATGLPLVLFGANCYSDRLPRGSWLVWDKRINGQPKPVMSDAEVAWHNRGHGVYIFAHTWDGFVRASERHTAYHPTQKPVALMRHVLERWGRKACCILDPYAGAGATLIAAKQTGRRAIGIELEERYCAIAAERLAATKRGG